jgi:hypothetical protein
MASPARKGVQTMNRQLETKITIIDKPGKDELSDRELETASGGSRPIDRATPLLFSRDEKTWSGSDGDEITQ